MVHPHKTRSNIRGTYGVVTKSKLHIHDYGLTLWQK